MKIQLSTSWLVALLLVLSSGCANLQVEVQILDNKYWASPEWLDEQAKQRIASRASQLTNNQFAEAQSDMRRAVDAALQVLVDEGKADASTLSALKEPFYQTISLEFA